ncbi:ABC transporter substrate-binding protein [Aurantivibrio infirmus]
MHYFAILKKLIRVAVRVGQVGNLFLPLCLVLAMSPKLYAQAQYGGTLTIALEADFPPFDPLSMGALVERTVAASFYETLFEQNENGELIPLLAKSYKVSEDGKTYTINLREGIKFHDGTSFNAAAVVSNFQRLLKPDNACRCIAEISFVDRVAVIDEYVVQFELARPNSGLIGILADVSGLQPSPTAIEKLGDKFSSQPVGTGPFRFVKWDRGIALTVEKNQQYWKQGIPYLDRVIYRPIPDTQTRMASLLAEDIDIVTVPAPEDIASVQEGKRKLSLVSAPGLGTVFTMFNTSKPPFDDVRVRQAMFHSIDRATINSALNKSVYPLVNNPYAEKVFGRHITNDFPSFDPVKTRQLLKEYAKPVKFELSITAVPTQVRMAQVFQQMWKQFGIEMTIQQLEQRQLVGKAIDGSFDAMLFRWSGRADPDLNAYQFFHSQSPRNYTAYNNPEMDALLLKGREAVQQSDRIDAYQNVADLLARDGPYLFLWSQRYYFITTPSVENLPPIPGGIPQLREVWLSSE